jgi:hypothetical protein
MPFLGIGLHLRIAFFFAVHVVKTSKQLYWLLILFSFPLLGGIVYFFAIFLPDSKLERAATKAVNTVANSLDPSKELREAKAEFGDTATAARLKHELEQMTKRWSKHTHELNRPLTRRLDTAFSKR